MFLDVASTASITVGLISVFCETAESSTKMHLWSNLFFTMWVGLHHGVGIDHFSDQLHGVVQQFSRSDVSCGSGFSLFKLSQQVTGSQSTLRQRLCHPGKKLNVKCEVP